MGEVHENRQRQPAADAGVPERRPGHDQPRQAERVVDVGNRRGERQAGHLNAGSPERHPIGRRQEAGTLR